MFVRSNQSIRILPEGETSTRNVLCFGSVKVIVPALHVPSEVNSNVIGKTPEAVIPEYCDMLVVE